MTAHDDTSSAVESTQTTAPKPAEPLPPIADYKLVDTLGEGGFGVVYLAEQIKPVRRKVALKVIKPGMDSKAVIARFEAERQALAMMNHPHVAKVFDAGTTKAGRPYFVMELVSGVPITEHCDRHKLSIVERLHLFIDVCEAVQHAHQKGIIHRDIKPSNILVEYRNEKSICKVIDFGVAKAIEQRLTEQTIFTQQGQMIGTPAYMSPEQAEMTAQDIDTRSDIYSLGVVLYQLLTGATPIETKSLLQAGFNEIMKVIRESEPQKPSTRVSGIDKEGESDTANIARNRKTNPDMLTKRLRGDLDWVTIKALEKDRARRYATATELADDIRRHLRNEPVIAGPPGSGYRFRKFIRRNKGPVAAVAAILVALLVGLAATMHLYVVAENARAEIAVQRDHAKREEETAKQVQEFLIDLFKVSDPNKSRGSTITAREIMDQAAKRIDRELAGQPLIQSALFRTISKVYEALGLYDNALPLARRALRLRRQVHGDRHLDVALSITGLAIVLKGQGRFEEAEKLQREALAIRKEQLGEEHPDVAWNLNNIANIMYSQGKYAEAEAIHRRVLALRRKIFGENHYSVAGSMTGLANIARRQGKYDQAEEFHQKALAIRRRLYDGDHPDLASSLNNLANMFGDQGKYAEAERLHRQALVMWQNLTDGVHPHLALSLNNLAIALAQQGKYGEVEGLHRQALEMRRKLLGEDHPDIAQSLANLATVLSIKGKYTEAEERHREALAMERRLHGNESIQVAMTLGNLAINFNRQREFPKAESYHRQALEMYRKIVGNDHPAVATYSGNLAFVLAKQGKYTEAETRHREALALRRKILKSGHPLIAHSVQALCNLLKDQGRLEAARPYCVELLELNKKRAEQPNATPEDLHKCAWNLLTIEPTDLRDPAAALPLAMKAAEETGRNDPGILDTLALAQQMHGDIDAAVETEKEAIKQLDNGPSWLRTELESSLAKYLVEQESFTEAQPLLVALYEELIDNSRSSTKEIEDSIARIVNLYESWHAAGPGKGYGAKAAEWQAKLPKPKEVEPSTP